MAIAGVQPLQARIWFQRLGLNTTHDLPFPSLDNVKHLIRKCSYDVEAD